MIPSMKKDSFMMQGKPFSKTMSIRSQESEQKSSLNTNLTLNKDIYLVIAFLVYVLKRGKPPTL